jgi:uncharacterized protein (DUF2236 family)
MRPVPPDWDAFQEYWDHMINHVLEDTRTVREGYRMHRTAPAPSLARLSERTNSVLGPYVLKPLLQAPAMRLMLWLTTASLGPVIRERLCLDWTTTDELKYRAHRKAVHAFLLALPDELQYFPLARKARRIYRETGVVAPLPLPTVPGPRVAAGEFRD